MRLITMTKLLLLGGAAALVFGKRGSKPAPARTRSLWNDDEPAVIPDSLDIDPADPVQQLDDLAVLHLEDLDVDAVSIVDVEVAQDLAGLESELDDEALLESEPTTRITTLPRGNRGSGELYGVYSPNAANTELPDDDAAFESGQNWIEALETSAAENGPLPEEELDILDDDDLDSPRTDTRDRPIADLGAAGPRGM